MEAHSGECKNYATVSLHNWRSVQAQGQSIGKKCENTATEFAELSTTKSGFVEFFTVSVCCGKQTFGASC